MPASFLQVLMLNGYLKHLDYDLQCAITDGAQEAFRFFLDQGAKLTYTETEHPSTRMESRDPTLGESYSGCGQADY